MNGFVLTELRKCTDTQSLLAALRSGRGEEPVPCAVSVEHIRVIGLSALKAYLCNLDHALVRRLDLNLSGELQLMIGPDPLCQAASLAAEVEAVLFEGFAT
ncbi:hypothetical protein [Dyella sp.]|uniref:hypothetical protein n=1 Tax=Dyella sp. TaxID=1869338 RepID=UPI002ED02C2B